MFCVRKCINVSCAKKEGCARFTPPSSNEAHESFAPDEDGNCFFYLPLDNLKNNNTDDSSITPLYLLLFSKEE